MPNGVADGGPRGGKVSARAEVVPSFVVMDVMAAACAREDELRKSGSAERVLHLEVGQPASGAPAAVRDAALKALADGEDALGYTLALGDLKLRSCIANMYLEKYNVSVEPEHIAVTTGSSGAFVATFTCLFDSGDRVCCPVPGYPCYRNILGALGVDVVMLPTIAANMFTPTVAELEEEIRSGGPLTGLVVASPGNPTGFGLSRERLQGLADFCEERNITLIVDEIYHGIGRHLPSALEVSDSVVVISSFSKYWSMSGWRLGFLVTRNRSMMEALERLLQNMHISAPSLSQRAALAAFDCEDELNKHVARYAANTRILLDVLPALGFEELREPDGAFYVYAEVSEVCRRVGVKTSVALCKEMLAKISVATTPGVDFDPVRGDRYVRFSVAGPTGDIEEAASRLRTWLT